MNKNKRVIKRFLEYVKIDSPTNYENNFKEHLKKELLELGLEVYEDEAGKKAGSNSGNLIAKLSGTGDKTILFSAHMDTVSPGINIKPCIKGDVIYSDGTTILGGDDKAGVAAIMEMLTVLKEEKISHKNIEVVFTIAEESGLQGSKYLEYSKLKADFAVVLDTIGPIGSVLTQGPSKNKITVNFKGKAAHAGMSPERGVSAIKIAANAINNMKLLKIDDETTANIGSISGGTSANIVPDNVEIIAEVRSFDEKKLKKQTEHILSCVKSAQAIYGIEADFKVEKAYKSFKLSESSLAIQSVKKACEVLGFDFKILKAMGGSDANNFNENAISAVNIGIGMTNCHGLDECIKMQDIIDCSKLILQIVRFDN